MAQATLHVEALFTHRGHTASHVALNAKALSADEVISIRVSRLSDAPVHTTYAKCC